MPRHFRAVHVERATAEEGGYGCPMEECKASFEGFEELVEHHWRSEGHARAVEVGIGMGRKGKGKGKGRWRGVFCAGGRGFQREGETCW